MDTYSEEYRHTCEAKTALRMPLLARQAHLQKVESRRGIQERRRLEGTMQRIWVDHQVDKLMAMDTDRERIVLLTRIERASGPRMRLRIETILEGRLTANDNKPKEDDEPETAAG